MHVNAGGAKHLSRITGKHDEKLESKIKQLLKNIRLKLAKFSITADNNSYTEDLHCLTTVTDKHGVRVPILVSYIQGWPIKSGQFLLIDFNCN